jgi:Leucine-rich repeat (LRR) protein
MQNLNGFVALPELEELNLQSNGLIDISGIDAKFPNLTILDISNNKIFSVDAIDSLSYLSNLAEINLNNNPIEVHKQYHFSIIYSKSIV